MIYRKPIAGPPPVRNDAMVGGKRLVLTMVVLVGLFIFTAIFTNYIKSLENRPCKSPPVAPCMMLQPRFAGYSTSSISEMFGRPVLDTGDEEGTRGELIWDVPQYNAVAAGQWRWGKIMSVRLRPRAEYDSLIRQYQDFMRDQGFTQ